MKRRNDVWERMSGGYERNTKTGKFRATMKYGSFDKTHDNDVWKSMIAESKRMTKIKKKYKNHKFKPKELFGYD